MIEIDFDDLIFIIAIPAWFFGHVIIASFLLGFAISYNLKTELNRHKELIKHE